MRILSCQLEVSEGEYRRVVLIMIHALRLWLALYIFSVFESSAVLNRRSWFVSLLTEFFSTSLDQHFFSYLAEMSTRWWVKSMCGMSSHCLRAATVNQPGNWMKSQRLVCGLTSYTGTSSIIAKTWAGFLHHKKLGLNHLWSRSSPRMD